jgi:acetylornithine deacetylase
LKPITRHKGIMMLNLRVEGTSGHSSDPALGNNAIEGMHRALTELITYRDELGRTHQDPRFDVSVPTMNFGSIHGGDNPNRICDHAELAFDLRNLPSMDMKDFSGALEDRVSRILGDLGFTCKLELLHSPVPAFDNGDSELAKEILALTGGASGSVAFGTEAPFLMDLELDTVVIGPGSINQAHQPNEYLPLAQIDPAIDLLSNLIGAHCT